MLGINTQIKYICDEPSEKDTNKSQVDLIRDAIKRDLLYVIQIDQACEQFNSINVLVLNQWRNVSDEAIKKYNFSNKISKIVSKKKNLIKGLLIIKNTTTFLNRDQKLLEVFFSKKIIFN